MAKRDKNEDLRHPFDKLTESQKQRERDEWANGSPARDDKGNPVK